jgi:DNA-directed RNA polymerase subunit RPC12/RpoP
MATEDTPHSPDAPQRVYRAPCPSCGAPVEFRSAQSTHAVCAYCQSSVVRTGEVLQRLGKMAELFDDHSPLQLLATGRALLGGRSQGFTLIGRLQFKGEAGVWTEWVAQLQNGGLATLSEDNGAYVFTQPVADGAVAPAALPPASELRVGASTALYGKTYSVAARLRASLIAAQGELPKLPPLGTPCDMVELRSADGELLSIDYSSAPPQVERGHAVALAALQMQGLQGGASVKGEQARQFSCPRCGASVPVTLETTQSLTCPSCNSLIDLSAGTGAELRAAVQDEPVRPLIPLGSKGQFEGVHWQVVGFQHRMGVEQGDDEQFGWEEYLLYHRQRGFAFLVDATDGWSLVRPATGAPKVAAGARSANYLGKTYHLSSAYDAETTYVAGEFYWPVQRGQKTTNRDYANSGSGLLSMEQTPSEITWSVGSKLDSSTVAQAFGLKDKKELFKRGDAAPVVHASGMGCVTVVLIVLVLIVLLFMMNSCSSSSGGGVRSSGGSYGGFSSGGGHK